MMTFGEQLEAIRKRVPMSCAQLAKKMGWSAVYQRDIELDHKRPPNTKRLKDYARHLGVDASELIILAIKEKKSVKLEVDPDRKIQVQTAAVLLRDWEALTDDQLTEIARAAKGSKPSQ